MIYADNAATTKLDPAAFEAMKPYLLEEYANASQPYSFSRKPRKALEEARATIADCIHAKPNEIFFTSGGTESNNWVIKGSALSDSSHRLTVTSAFEHHALLRSCSAMERIGYPVAYLQPSPDGQITTEELERCLSRQTRLVSIMFANNELGSIQSIAALCEKAHAHGARFHTDAVQAVGHVEIDVQKLGVDFLSASAHKFNGPKGIGFLYIREGTPLSPYADGGAQERGYRAGTENVAGIVGMATALRENCYNLNAIQQHLRLLERILLSKLHERGVSFFRNGGTNTLPGLMSLSFPGFSGEMILHRMDLMGVCISTGSACDSRNVEISHVLQAVGLDEQLARGTIRISLGKNNTPEDANAIADALIKIVRGAPDRRTHKD